MMQYINSKSSQSNEANMDKGDIHSGEKKRLKQAFQDDHHFLSKIVTKHEDDRTNRLGSILSLKENIESAGAKAQEQSSALQCRQLAEEYAKKQSAQELLNQGKNPYEEARRKQVQHNAEREGKLIEDKIHLNWNDIVEHIKIEKVNQARQKELLEKQVGFNKKYQAEMGQAAVGLRRSNYLLSRTGKTELDQTGKKYRIFPSQETVLKDNSFGLGKNLVHNNTQRNAMIDLINKKPQHRNVKPQSSLLPKWKPNQLREELSELESSSTNVPKISSNNDTDVAKNSAEVVEYIDYDFSGKEHRSMNHAIVENCDQTAHVTPSLSTFSNVNNVADRLEENDAIDLQKKGFGKPVRSVLEQRMLVEAKERQRTNIFQRQIVWGKEFIGKPFLSDPSVLIFKDFQPGKPQRMKFTLTNVSNTFNHFRFLEFLEPEMRDWFDITYIKPGRMAAGKSVKILIVFTAIYNTDFDTVLPAIAQTGPFEIPIRCLSRKAVPVLDTSNVEFRDVIAGEKLSKSVKIQNQGALPLGFTVKFIGEQKQSTPTMVGSAIPFNHLAGQVSSCNSPAQFSKSLSPRDGKWSKLEGNQNSEILRHNHLVDNVIIESSPTNFELDESQFCSSLQKNDSNLSPINPPGNADGEATELGILHYAKAATNYEPNGEATELGILNYAKAATNYEPRGFECPIRYTLCGVVPPYSSSLITFTFTPASPMTIHHIYAINFVADPENTEGESTNSKVLPSKYITLSANANEVPIFVGSNILDFACCGYDKLYRHRLVVHNRGKVALKIQVAVPKELQGHAEFGPSVGYVQGSSYTTPDDVIHNENKNGKQEVKSSMGTFTIQVKFRPRADMWKQLEKKKFGLASLGFFAVPVQIIVPDQVVPVYFIITARVTSIALQFSSRRLDFGTCPPGHAVFCNLQVKNVSCLPQRIGFVDLPSSIRVETPASNGIGYMLPQETIEVRVIYQPNSATALNSHIICRTSGNHTQGYPLLVFGSCISSPISLSHTFIELGATQLGQTQCANLLLSNTSDRSQKVELAMPDNNQPYLRVTPLVATIPAFKSVRIEVEFNADENLFTYPRSIENVRNKFDIENQNLLAIENSNLDDQSIAASENDRATDNTQFQLVEGSTSFDTRLKNTQDTKATSICPINETLSIRASEEKFPWEYETAEEERSCHHIWNVLCFQKQKHNYASSRNLSDVQVSAASSPRASGLFASFCIRTTVVQGKIFPSTSNIRFGQVSIGDYSIKELTITNLSSATVELASKPLHVLGAFRLMNCLRPIPAHKSLTLKVKFEPSSPLLYEDELDLLSSTTCNIKVRIEGEGVNPTLQIHPIHGIIDFKDVLAKNQATIFKF